MYNIPMGMFEYEVGLAAPPDELNRIAIAFRAGQQRERDIILEELLKLSKDGHINQPTFVIERLINGSRDS